MSQLRSESMSAEILIVVPVLNRPQNAAPLVQSIVETAQLEWLLLFVVSPGDDAELEACLATLSISDRVDVAHMPDGPGAADYAKKVQRGYDSAVGHNCPYVLCAADDLKFHAGWDTAAVKVFEDTGAGVVGTADLGNRQTMTGEHSTHPFVRRAYIDLLGGVVGEPGRVYCDQYDHQFVDVELVQTAMARDLYAHASGSVIEHKHALWKKAPMDDTYRRALKNGAVDKRLFESRKHLWLNEDEPGLSQDAA